MTKLSNDQVSEIKTLLSEKNLTQLKIGEKFGISRSVISDIATGRIHKDVADVVSEADTQFLKLRGEIEHLREERNDSRRKLKSVAKTQGLFSAIVEEMETRVVPMTALPDARPVYTSGEQITESLVMHLSDEHLDQIVTPADTGGLESYDFRIGMCRAERYVDTILKWTQCTLAPQYRFPSLTVLAYGDHSSGELHGHTSRSYFRNDFKNSIAIGQLHSLMFRDLAPYFDQVNVVYVPGNHGRRSPKKDYLGAHNNWDYLIAKTAELYCADIKNMSFAIPNSFSANVDIDGVGFNVSHGDDVRSSLGIPWYGIEKRKYKLLALNSVRSGIPIRYFVCGHFHRPGSTTELNGEMIINGAWPASDAFAFNALTGYTEPSQLLHGVNKKYGVTWRLPVKLKCEYEKTGPKRYRIDMMDEVG
jgi:UDP-2,3-diacylglucosamine pyrophosphatase LpxH/biotin operon repressor